jgi:O-glycosyl hydrolase
MPSPAMCPDYAANGDVHSAFFENCAGCQVDGIALHWYGGGMGDLQPFVQSAYKYNKPIYLTGTSILAVAAGAVMC